MSFTLLVVFFLIYSFIGWIVDTAIRSFEEGKWKTGSFFPIPFCPLYGFGALLILGMHTVLGKIPLLIQIAIMGVVLAGFEYIAGILVLRLSGRRLWHYPKSFLNIGGFTDFWHAVLWAELAAVVIIIHPLLFATFFKMR